jgi:transposase
MNVDRVRDGEPKATARRRVSELLDVNPAALRNWVEAAEQPAEPSGLSLVDEVARLRTESAELRRAEEISRTLPPITWWLAAPDERGTCGCSFRLGRVDAKESPRCFLANPKDDVGVSPGGAVRHEARC